MGVLLVALSGARCAPEDLGAAHDPAEPPAAPANAAGPYEVVRVVDGDTLVLDVDGEQTTVRLIGVDTPETVHPTKPVECFGPEAAAATRELADGRSLWLEHDPTQGTHDRYGRTLAYVWLEADTMLNEVLVQGGYAREYTYAEPYAHRGPLLAAQAAAQAAGAGLWSPATCNGQTTTP